MSPNLKGMFGAVVISQPELDIVTVVNKNSSGKVVMIRFAIATPRAEGFGGPVFKVIAFTGRDFKTGSPRDMGSAGTLVAAMAVRETIIAQYVKESDEAKMENVRFGNPGKPNARAVPPFPGTPIR